MLRDTILSANPTPTPTVTPTPDLTRTLKLISGKNCN